MEKRNRNAATHQKIYSFLNDKPWRSETEVQQRTKKSSHFRLTNCGEAKNEVQQRNKKSSHFQMTNCGEAKNEVQQRTKKSSHFQMINCGQAKLKCSNAPKNLVIFN